MKFVVAILLACSCATAPVDPDLLLSTANETLEFIGIKGVEVDKPGLEQAKKVIWNDIYGEWGTPPKVLIVEGSALTCTDPNNGGLGFSVIIKDNGIYHQGCRQGFTFLPTEVSVALFDNTPWWRTSLAHEYMHAHQSRHGVFQPDHSGPEWQHGGLVDKANAAVQAAQPFVIP